MQVPFNFLSWSFILFFSGGLDDVELLKIGNGTPKKDDLDRSAKNRASERYPVPHKKVVKEDKENTRPSRPSGGSTNTPKKTYPTMENSPLSPSRSVDSGLNKKDWVFATPEKPVGGYKKDRKVIIRLFSHFWSFWHILTHF